jgi:hypothetical protein
MFSRTFTLLVALVSLASAGPPPLKTRHVLFITTDGLRWQEVFRGPEERLMKKATGGVPSEAALRDEFWAPTAEERRVKLMPFLWGEVAAKGQLYGNRDAGSEGDLTNGYYVSYPGYNELLAGYPDARIWNNMPLPNVNLNVLELLNSRPGFGGKVAAINAWHVLPKILNRARSRIPMWTPGLRDPGDLTFPRRAELDALAGDIILPWVDEHFDAFVFAGAQSYLSSAQPRLLYVNFGETDEWAHEYRYDKYLHAARNVDRWVRTLWETVQAKPEMRGTTTLVFTTDHGRGNDEYSWVNHGAKFPGSGEWWFAVLGPDTPPLGERKHCAPVKQAQTAATIARLLGEDYRGAVPEAAGEIGEVFAK